MYHVFVFFKLFKLLMISRINRSINLIQDQLKEVFVQNKITVENMFGYMKAAFTFLILIHFFACVWLFTGAIDGEWMTEEQRNYDSAWSELYANAIYFISTTMTSVGYGDINAWTYQDSMMIVYCTQFFGILGFALVKDQVFSAKRVAKIDEIVKQTMDVMEDALFRIDRLKDGDLPSTMYDEAMADIGTIYRFSINESFADNSFWKSLPPQIKKKLFSEVLSNVIERFDYFFNDYVMNVVAPPVFV